MSASPPLGARAATLGNLLRAWGDAGEAPPAAVVAAIVHEIAMSSAQARRPSSSVDADRVWIDAEGHAQTEQPATVPALAELMEQALSGSHPGRTGDLMPPTARGGLDRFRGWDGVHQDGCWALAAWIRDVLGPLADPEEVARCCRASAPMDPEAPTTLPAPAALPEAAPREAFTELPEPLEVPEAVEVASGPPAAAEDSAPEETEIDEPGDRDVSAEASSTESSSTSSPAAATAPPAPATQSPTTPPERSTSWPASGSAAASEPGSSGERPVVRRELPRRETTVSIVSAPAARRSARPLADRGDSILVPADAGPGRGWLLLLLGIVLAVGIYFLVTG